MAVEEGIEMFRRQIALVVALLVGCGDDADDESNSVDDATVEDAAADLPKEAGSRDEFDAEAGSLSLDATTQGDAGAWDGARDGASENDAPSTPDGSLPAPTDAGGSCLTTRTAPDPTLLYLPGKVFLRGAGVRGLADFEDTVLGYITSYRASVANFDAPTAVGWTLWRKSTGELIDDSELTPDSQRATGIFMHAAGERFLVQERAGGPVELVLRDARDGREVWRVGGWSIFGEKRLPQAGVSKDGSFVWAAAPLGDTTSTVFEVFNTSSTTPIISFTTAAAVRNVWSGSDEIIAFLSDATTTTLRRFNRAGVEAPATGPLPGKFVATFTDESHFITSQTNVDTRVYSRSGDLKFSRPEGTNFGGGIGNYFWTAGGMFHLNEGTVPYAILGPNWRILTEGEQEQGNPRFMVMTASGTEEKTALPDAEVVLFSRGQLIQLTPTGIKAPSFARPLGCGYTVTAADSKRLFVSGSASATYVYQAPFEKPTATLPPASQIVIARGQERFALRTSANEVTVYGPDFQLVGKVAVQASDDISLSFQGEKLGTSRYVAASGPTAATLHSEIIDVASGRRVYALDQNPAGAPARPPVALAPRFSPSGQRFAFSARRTLSTYLPTAIISDGSAQLGSITGPVFAWVDEESMIAWPFSSSIVSAQGVVGADFACNLDEVEPPTLWVSPNTYARPFQKVIELCDLVSNTRITDVAHPGLDYPVWLSDGPIGLFGAQAAYLRSHNVGVRIR